MFDLLVQHGESVSDFDSQNEFIGIGQEEVPHKYLPYITTVQDNVYKYDKVIMRREQRPSPLARTLARNSLLTRARTRSFKISQYHHLDMKMNH